MSRQFRHAMLTEATHDVAAPMLRYVHARAEALGKRVHFSQQYAEATDLPDGFFDLILSQIVIHEISRRALP